MCMRKFFEDQESGEVLLTSTSQPSLKDPNEKKLLKAKDHYIKQHNDMLLREAETVRKNEKSKLITDPEINIDQLAKITFLYGLFINRMSKYYFLWRHSKAYKILFYTTQPAHVIMITAVLCVASALIPSSERSNAAGQPHSRVASFIYLASFVMHFGAQIWMTFVSGLSLYFALPRHTFGEVQRILFPRYFSLNACLSLITLLIFVKHHPINTWDTEIAIQVAGMSGAFFLELLIRLYLTPPLLRLIIQKNALERAAGVGSEIGRHNPGPLKHCPHYLAIHQAFRRIHVSIAMGNMVTMACTVLHLYYISSKLCVL